MTIKEAFDAAPKDLQGAVLSALIKKGASNSSAYQWCKGQRRPSRILRPTVATILNKELKTSYTVEELWPEQS